MGIFSKKSSSTKIPPVAQQQPQGQQPGGYGGPAGRQGGAYAGLQPQGAYNSQQGYAQQPSQQGQYGGGYQQQPPPQHAFQQTSVYRDAKAPTKLGSGYDQMISGGQSGQRGGAGGRPPPVDDLEAEYGAGSGASSSRYNGSGGYDGGEQAQEMTEEDEEIEGIKQQMRFTKQESLSSTRNALRIARETEETASGTILKLGEQSGE